jgi:hypothetical protein
MPGDRTRFAAALAPILAFGWSVAASTVVSPLSKTASTDLEPPADSRRVDVDGTSLGGFVLPILPIAHDLELDADTAVEWSVDDTKRLFLRGNAQVRIGTYDFRADEAVIWVDRIPSAAGLVTQIAAWFPAVSEPTRRAGLGASGRDVLVTASLSGTVKLRTLVLEDGPVRSNLVARGERRLARYLRTLIATPPPPLRSRPEIEVPPAPPTPQLAPGGRIVRSAGLPEPGGPDAIDLPATEAQRLGIFDPRGLVSFTADEIVIDENRDAIAVVGSVVIDYDGTTAIEDLRRLSLVAERGVIFLTPGTIRGLREGGSTVQAEAIEGIYLEGGVRASDGDYTVRGSSVYYDLPNNQALLMDAVLRTYTRSGRSLPVYARADEMRQIASDQWSATRATISTSEFFTPHLSIGLDRVTITERPSAAGGSTTWVKGDGLAMRLGSVPFFYWPGFEGPAEEPPIEDFRTGYQQDKGFGISTRWNIERLLGVELPEGVDGKLLLDGWIERGPAAGLVFGLEGIGGVRGSGDFDAYGLYDFGGTDRTSAGRDVQIEEGMRGQVVGDYRAVLSADLRLEAQLAYLSDETWASSWRQREYTSRRQYESSLYFDFSPDNTAVSVLVRGQANDFLSNGYVIAARPYFVEKLPELNYDREGDDIADIATWSSVWNFSSMALHPTAGSANSLGVREGAFAVADPNRQVENLYFDSGYREGTVNRFFTRQEVAFPVAGEGWAASPFVFGRFAGYMQDDFEDYRTQQQLSADEPPYSLMLGGGVRASAQFQTVDDRARSDTFDIHRLRHILEPNATLWWAWDDQPDGWAPIYDQRIEGATGGTVAQVGMRQTLQTQRGGIGNRRSVDMVVLDYGVVFNDGADDFQATNLYTPDGLPNRYAWAQSPYPSFYRWEPELSQWGSHGYMSGLWRVSSALTFAADGLFSWESREVWDLSGSDPELRTMSGLLRGSVGVELEHNPDSSSFIEYRSLSASDDDLLQAGLLYRIGRLYQVAVSPQYDLRRDEFRSVTASIRRTLPDFDFSGTIGYDLVRDQTIFGVRLSVPPQPGVGFPTY